MKNILLVGEPEAAITSLIMRLGEIFKEFNPAGFFTSEIVEDGTQTGYELFNFNGDSKVVAHTGIKSRHFLGRFKIDMKGFENFLEGTFLKDKKKGFYIIDEIGKLECKSRKFSRLIVELLNSDKPVLATIPGKGTGLIQDIKKRNDVMIMEITPENWDLRLKELTMKLRDTLLE